MVERLGRADLAGITREGEELQVPQHLIPGTFPALARSNKTNDRAVFVSWLLQRLVLYSYMMYLETIFRTCTRISRERGKFMRGMIVLDLTGARKNAFWKRRFHTSRIICHGRLGTNIRKR